MAYNISTLKNIDAEAGVISTLLYHPDFYYSFEFLQRKHFFNNENGLIYYAIVELIKNDINNIDPFNIMAIFSLDEDISKKAKMINERSLQDLFEDGLTIARNTPEEYGLLVNIIMDNSIRRDVFNGLLACQAFCFEPGESIIQQKVYTLLDDIINSYEQVKSVVEMKDIIDHEWSLIEKRQAVESDGVEFKFPTLNNYCTIMRSELFLIGAQQKIGKSAWLLNSLVDLLSKGIKCLYIDSELSTKIFILRLISHITKIPFISLKYGKYNEEERGRIEQAKDWIKSKHFIHEYTPEFDRGKIMISVKKARAKMGLDCIIVDYFKSPGETDAFAVYSDMGKTIDMIKNKCCGEMDLMGLGAVQLTRTNQVADSAKIARNTSTLAILDRKTPQKIAEDGVECGNSWMNVRYNRNGPQMMEDEYIDLLFDGNTLTYQECKQHTEVKPY